MDVPLMIVYAVSLNQPSVINIIPFDTQAMYNREKNQWCRYVHAHGLLRSFILGNIYNSVSDLSCSWFIRNSRNDLHIAGRTLSDLEHQGTGTDVFIQNGSNPLRDVVKIPQWETELNQTNWNRGVCYPTMGKLQFLLSLLTDQTLS